MRYSRYIGRVGALAVALGIGAGLAAAPWVASAAPSDRSHADVSVTTNGVQRVQIGDARSSADGDGTHLLAIAHGAGSSAAVSGDFNKAIANGDNTTAIVTGTEHRHRHR